MEKKKKRYNKIDLTKEFSKMNETEAMISLALVAGIFCGDGIFGGKTKKDNDIENRLSKLETKTEMIEKIILK